MEGQISDAGVRLFGEEYRRREIRRGISLPIGDLRQVGDLPVADVVGRRDRPQELARARPHACFQLDPAPREVTVRGTDHLAKPPPAAVEIGRDRKARSHDASEEDRLLALGLRELGYGRELVMRIDLALHHPHLAATQQRVDVVSHASSDPPETIRYFRATRSISTRA